MIYLDSSDPKEIASILPWGVISSITTNPLIMARQGVTSLEDRVDEILEVVSAAGYGSDPAASFRVHVELVSTDVSAMAEEAHRYAERWGHRIAIKIPLAGPNELSLIHRLATRDLLKPAINATCLMTPGQVYLAREAGAAFASVFFGRIEDEQRDAYLSLRMLQKMYSRESCDLIVASIRNAATAIGALSLGVDIVTVTPKILHDLLRCSKTTETVAEFNQAWAERPR